MVYDRKRWAITRKQMYIEVKRTTSLDDLISVLKKWYSQLTGENWENESVKYAPPKVIIYNKQIVDNSDQKQDAIKTPDKIESSPPKSDVEIITCPHCGEKIEFTPDIIFCPKCGMPID
ncbi:MAG: hypothetical protein ACTSPQ_12970 [Candidatus Helarchaeota archaeon]